MTKTHSTLYQDQSFMEFNGTNGALSAQLFAKFRGTTTATTILPLLSGDRQLVARQFNGRQAAFAHIQVFPMLFAILLLFLTGIIGCLCVPALPKGFPKRRFDMYSWLMAVKGDGLMLEDPMQPGDDLNKEWKPGMTLEEAEKIYGKKPVVIGGTSNKVDSDL